MFDEPEELRAFIEEHGGYWEGECLTAPLEAWIAEIRNYDTRCSYWEWAYRTTEMDE